MNMLIIIRLDVCFKKQDYIKWYLKVCNFEELACPNLWRLDEYLRSLRSNRRLEHLDAMRKPKMNRKE